MIVLGVITVALAITVVVQAVEILRPNTKILWGSISEALAAFGTLLAVGVALWQSTIIRRQAEEQIRVQQGIADAERLRQDTQLVNEVVRLIDDHVQALMRLTTIAVDAAKQTNQSDREASIRSALNEVERTQLALNLQHREAQMLIRDKQLQIILGGVVEHGIMIQYPLDRLVASVRDGGVVDTIGLPLAAGRLMRVTVKTMAYTANGVLLDLNDEDLDSTTP